MTRPRAWRAAAAVVLGLATAGAEPPGQPTPQRWSPADVQELLQTVENSYADGLRPQDYGLTELVTALVAGSGDMDRLADHSALALAH
jgi:hypothetical protein